LEDVLDVVGDAVDIFKFSGGSFAVMPERTVKALIDMCHERQVRVSTGGFIEHVLMSGPGAVDRYFEECHRLGFDIVEISSGFLSVPIDDLARLTARAKDFGLWPKPEVNVQHGAGGSSSVEALEAQGGRDVGWAIEEAERHLEAGAELIMFESEGVTENVRAWRTDVIAQVVQALGLDRVMFEAADPAVFSWYVQNFGPEVNLFVDHSQALQLQCLRAGIWGTADVWGRVLTYKGPTAEQSSMEEPAPH
jgi:phosphosulfolactate synthase (CoM biosynthesis protein A)